MDTPIGTIEVQTTAEGHIIRDVSTLFSYIDSNSFPFDTLLRQMPQGPKAQSWKIEWETVRKHPRRDETTVDYGGGEAAGTVVTLDVLNGNMWRVKDSIILIGIADAPPLHVQSVVSATQITVVALSQIGAAGATAGGLGVVPAIPVGTTLAWTGNIQEEGFTYSQGRSMQPAFGYNFEELCDLTVEITKTRQAIRNYSQLQDWERAQRDQFKEARRTMELKVLLQVASYSKSSAATGAKYQWSMNGVKQYITKTKEYANNATNGSRITEYQLIDWMVELFSDNTGSRQRIWLVDAYLGGELDKALVKTTWNKRSEYLLGVKVNHVSSSQGDLMIVPEPMFNEVGLDHYGMILDLESISRRSLREMEARKLDLVSVGVDKDAVQLLEQTSIEVLNPDAHMETDGVPLEELEPEL